MTNLKDQTTSSLCNYIKLKTIYTSVLYQHGTALFVNPSALSPSNPPQKLTGNSNSVLGGEDGTSRVAGNTPVVPSITLADGGDLVEVFTGEVSQRLSVSNPSVLRLWIPCNTHTHINSDHNWLLTQIRISYFKVKVYKGYYIFCKGKDGIDSEKACSKKQEMKEGTMET